MMTSDARLCPECRAPVTMPTWSECSPECSLKRAHRTLVAIAGVYADVLAARLHARDAIDKIGDILAGAGR